MSKKDIVLTIGMIVKNEENVIRRCLESLEPLIAGVSSELIITDTGSDDSTSEIIKEYTDNILSYKWNDDFAAARNTTVSNASGKWYMYIDADEYFDGDISELIDFFNNEEINRKYNSADIIVRSNINTDNGVGYKECRLSRFHRLVNDETGIKTMFQGKIHETIPAQKPLYSFKTVLQHSGYYFNTIEDSYRKKERNLVMLRSELSAAPDDMRLLSLIIDSSVFHDDETEEYILRAIKLAKKNRNNIFSNILFYQSAKYYKEKNPEYALKIVDDYFRDISYNKLAKTSCTLSVLLLKSEIFILLNDYKNAADSLKQYRDLFILYKSGKMNLTEKKLYPLNGFEEYEFFNAVFLETVSNIRIKNFDCAIILLDKLYDMIKCNFDFEKYYGVVREFTSNIRNFDYLIKVYNRDYCTSDLKRRKLVLELMENVFYSLNTSDEKHLFFKSINEKSRDVIWRKISEIYTEETDCASVYGLTDNIENLSYGCSELIYLLLKNKIDASEIVNKISSDAMNDIFYNISEHHSDYVKIVIAYTNTISEFQSIKHLLFYVEMLKYAANNCGNMNSEQKYLVYSRFVDLLGDYVSNIYNPELFDDEDDLDVLTPLHRFGVYIYKAKQYLLNGEYINYINELKKSLSCYENAVDIIRILLRDFAKKN